MKRVLALLFLFLYFHPDLYPNQGNNSTYPGDLSPYLLPEIQESTNNKLESFILWENSSTKDSLPQILLQKSDKYGAIQWAKTVDISTGPSRVQIGHKLITDRLGGVIIVWEERSLDNEETDIYATISTSATRG